MNDESRKKSDPLIDRVRDTRQRLVHEHGDLRGWVKHLQQLQQQHPERVVHPAEETVD
jgi:hypothetical protein